MDPLHPSLLFYHQNFIYGDTDHIDSGGFGDVYRARLAAHDRQKLLDYHGEYLALKFVNERARFSERNMKNLLKEAAILGQIPRHHNIVILLGVCCDPKHFALVLEYVDGDPLAHLLETPYMDDWKKRSDACRQISCGMNHLHNQEPPVIHMDLTSYNVLTSVTEGRLTCKIADFGLSKVRNISSTAVGAKDDIPGTLHFVAPERFRGERLSLTQDPERTKKLDVYSFGIIMFHVKERALPYEDELPNVLRINVMGGISPPFSDKECPTGFNDLMMKSYHKEALRRPSFQDIYAFLCGLPSKLDCGINHSEREEMTDCFSSVVDPGRDQEETAVEGQSQLTKKTTHSKSFPLSLREERRSDILQCPPSLQHLTDLPTARDKSLQQDCEDYRKDGEEKENFLYPANPEVKGKAKIEDDQKPKIARKKISLLHALNEERRKMSVMEAEKAEMQCELQMELKEKSIVIEEKAERDCEIMLLKENVNQLEELLTYAEESNALTRQRLKQSEEALRIPSCDIELTDKKLGHGSYGEVPIAYWRGCPVAVKMLYEVLAASQHNIDLLLREVSISWKIHHPNIAAVWGLTLELEEEKKKAWIVMELLQGSMAGVIDESRRRGVKQLTLREKADMAHDSVCGLNYLHSLPRLVIHGDIRPTNILVSAMMRAKLGDLGSARFSDASLTVGLVSPEYTATERMDGQSAQKSNETDVYSMGVTMCELFTGVPPHRDDRLDQIQFVRQRDVRFLCMKMVSDEPSKRPSAANALTAIDRIRITHEYKACPPRRMVKGMFDGVENITLTDRM